MGDGWWDEAPLACLARSFPLLEAIAKEKSPVQCYRVEAVRTLSWNG